MSSLFYFLFWAALIFLMMRFGCGAHVMGHRNKKGHTDVTKTDESEKLREMVWVAPPVDVDPVCGTKVNTKTAKSSVFEGTVYYLCSRECREIFEANPNEYIGEETRKISDARQEVTHA